MFRYMMLLAVAATLSTGQSATSPSPPLPADRQVTVDGVSLHYLDWGGTGEPLVFLPPGCETAHIFGDIAPAFTDRFRVLGPTTRGCGQSGRADAYDLDTQVKETAMFLDTLGLERATIFGFSASGGKAIRFARQHPSRVRRLVVFDSVYFHVAEGFEEKMGTAITQRISGSPDASAVLYRQYHEAWELGAWSEAMNRNLRNTHVVSSNGALRPVGAPEWWAAFRLDMKEGRYFETRITHPALMFFAVDLDQERLKQFDEAARADMRPLAVENDLQRREQIDQFRQNGPHVRIIAMPETAHYGFVHRPADVIREMRRFLAEESPR